MVRHWNERRTELEASEAGQKAVAEFLARLVRSWSIETGILERIYTLDESVTLTLVEQGFDAVWIGHGASDLPAGKLLEILGDHESAAEGLFSFVKGQRELSTSYIHELHQQLLRRQETAEGVDATGVRRNVPVLRGAYKLQPNNPADAATGVVRHEYCPPEQVASEMDRLIEMHRSHDHVPFEIEAAWLHHRFTQIHPYQDGNGRVARALATLLCLKAGSLPLVVDRADRVEYIRALEKADSGDLLPLIELFRRLQVGALLRLPSIGVASAEQGLGGVLDDVGRRLLAKRAVAAPGLPGYAQQLGELAFGHLAAVEQEIRTRSLPVATRVLTLNGTAAEQHWPAVVQSARELGYEPDPGAQRTGAHLQLAQQGPDVGRIDFVVSIHGVQGHGACACIALLVEVGVTRGAPDIVLGSHKVIGRSPFTFVAMEPFERVAASFGAWLDKAVALGMASWRDSL